MANEPVNPKRMWFDIEDTGVGGLKKGHHFYKSSILQLSFASESSGPISDLAARPENKQMSTWSHQKVWKPLEKKAAKGLTVLRSEKEILGQFIKQLELNTGSELIGWNTGYSPEVLGREKALRGFDIAGLMIRSHQHGLSQQMQAALNGVKIRDLGQEFAVRMTKGMFNNLSETELKGTLGQEIYQQALGFKKQLDVIGSLYGVHGAQAQAQFVSEGGIHFSGWSQSVALKLMKGELGEQALASRLFNEMNEGLTEGDPRFNSRKAILDAISGKTAHQADIDVAIARMMTDWVDGLDSSKDWGKMAKRWGSLAEMNKAIGRIKHSGFSGARIQEVTGSTWFKALEVSKDTQTVRKFWENLVLEAKDMYGAKNLPSGAGTWEEALGDLKPGETLASKFSLTNEGVVSTFKLGGFANKISGKLASNSTLAGIAKSTIGGIAKQSAKILGKRGGVAIAALAASTALNPLQLLGSDSEAHKEQISNKWQHILLGEELEINRIPARDDFYNIIEGLPHTGHANFSRRDFADFGSGWIPQNGIGLALSDPELSLAGSFEAMRRVQEATKDNNVDPEEYNSFLRAMRYKEDMTLVSHLVNKETYFGRGFGYLDEALKTTPLESDEYFGVRVDPTVMDFRREVLQNSDKRLAFDEQLQMKQREALDRLGRFKNSELHEVNLSEYKDMALQASGQRSVNLADFHLEVEDADTLVLRRKGAFNALQRAVGLDKEISIRLAGIDAPETADHSGDPLEELGARINQEQPYGREATMDLKKIISESENLQLLVSSEPQTYGRYTGAIFGEMKTEVAEGEGGEEESDDFNSWGDSGKSEQVNLNMELLRRGSVAALPFGSQSKDTISRHTASSIQDKAADEGRGIWQFSRYQAHKQMTDLLSNSITFNTFTNKRKLADNLDLATYSSYLESLGSSRVGLNKGDKNLIKDLGGPLLRHGFSGRKRPDYMKGYNKRGRTFKQFTPPPAVDYGEGQIFQKKIPISRPWLKADDDFHNTIEAFRHEGQAFSGRRKTDFGSGWDGDKAEAKIHPFEESPNTGNTFMGQAKAETPPSTQKSKENAVAALAAKDISVYNSNNRKGVSTSTTELTAQVQGEKFKKGNLALETKKFSWDSDPSRGSRSSSTPTKVDNTKNTNSIKDNNYIDRDLKLDSIAMRNKRAFKFRSAHMHAIRSIESSRRNPGKRSKMNRGSRVLS